MLLSSIANINGRFTFISIGFALSGIMHFSSNVINVTAASPPLVKGVYHSHLFHYLFRVMSKSKVNFGNDKATFVGVILPTHSVILTD